MSADPMVEPAWLAARLGDPGLRIIDASWFMPAAMRDPKAEFEAGHIPGAVFFGIDEVSDHTSELPHMLATAGLLSWSTTARACSPPRVSGGT
jgi:thiosulfate/3-mercaptopyruvate sulfurtransferase